MKNIVTISNFKEGKTIQGFFLCLEKSLRHSRNGDLYIDIIIRDQTGKINAKIWDKVNEFDKKFQNGDAVAIKGTVEVYQKKIYLIIKRINKATVQNYARYGFDPALISPSAKVDSKIMWKETLLIIKTIKSPVLRKMVMMVYDQYKNKIIIFPDSVSKNHNYISGLLEHILSMAKIGSFLAKYYKLNKDIVLVSIFFLDLGKIFTLKAGYQPTKNKIGNLLGHIFISRDLLIKFSKKVKGIDKSLILEIEHIITSVPTPFEKQSFNFPSSKEAIIVNAIKHLDSRINIIQSLLLLENQEEGMTNKHNIFGRPLYSGKDVSK